MVYQLTKDLETGDPLIDREHRELLRAVNNLMDECAKGKGRAALEPTLRFLLDYVKGAEHHRDGRGGQILLQEINTALTGHLHVHRDDVRFQDGDFPLGVQSVDCITDHLDPGMDREAFDQ